MGGIERVLVTGGRFPAALALTRALDEAGAHVTVADSVPGAPALHSRHARGRLLVAPAADDPERFASDLADAVTDLGIDLIVPAFEEGLYAARAREEHDLPLFAPAFDTLLRLHDKAAFQSLCAGLGIATPRTRVVRSRDELAAAANDLAPYVARPAFSRGGTRYLTDHGPRAGERSLEECDPSPTAPWIVQAYVDGDDACSFSIARSGEVVLHCSYRPSIATPGGYSLQFTTSDDLGDRGIAERLAAELGLTGCFGLDFRLGPDGPVVLECNPRGTAGVLLAPHEWVAGAILGADPPRRAVPAGVVRQYDAELLLSRLPGVGLGAKLRALAHTPDPTLSVGDPFPGLYLLLSIRHASHVAAREHLDVAAAFSADIQWNGAPSPG